MRWQKMKKAAHGGMNRPFIKWKRKKLWRYNNALSLSTLKFMYNCYVVVCQAFFFKKCISKGVCENPSSGDGNTGVFLPGLKTQPRNTTHPPQRKQLTLWGGFFVSAPNPAFKISWFEHCFRIIVFILRPVIAWKNFSFRLILYFQAAIPDVSSGNFH